MTSLFRSWLAAFAGMLLGTASAGAQAARPIEFNRDVRPILSDACFQCHGPDKAKRKAGLRLDTEEGAFVDLGGHFAVVPGKPAESELLRRVTTTDDAKRMPPKSAALRLSPNQIDILKRWIAEGAAWQTHWSFIPPKRPAVPAVKDTTWPRNPIDHFVLARLEQEGLRPSPEADPITILRRMSFDLTGLPPSPSLASVFEAQWKNADSAQRQILLEKLADDLLRSPRYGERMAQRWLDGARYADTNGYQTDGERIMWRWRDWVIDAFNHNMPFDQFTIEQIAGDMLPQATLDQKIATGFNRNHRGNSEGGVIPEEFAVEYVVDRVDTTATVWLGLTAGCARCHDHKYDPISQKEFYQLFAYFNNVPERGKAIKYGNSPPYIKSPTREQQKKLEELTRICAKKSAAFQDLASELHAAQSAWEKKRDPAQHVPWSYHRGLLTHLPLETDSARATTGFNGEKFVDAGNVGAFSFFDKFSIGAWVCADGKRDGGTVFSRMEDVERGEGYSLSLAHGTIHVHLVKRWLDDSIRVESEQPVSSDQWHHILFSYDGSRVAAGVKLYVDGQAVKLKVKLDDLNQNFSTKEPFRVGAGGGPAQRFFGGIRDVRIFDHVLAPEDVASLANRDAIEAIAALPPARRSPAQSHKLRSWFLDTQAAAHIRQAFRDMLAARAELERFDESLPTTMVMVEMPTPRDTHILLRGEYDKKGPRVQPGVPRSLHVMPRGTPNNRLGLAHWLVAADNPLTARVAMNRWWQMLFGQGIVRTVEDFGAQGDWPSHPDLLDWLAVEFAAPDAIGGKSATAWDVKRMLKTMVTSATYRQSSRLTPELHQKDPENRLLARGPRFRLAAGMIRDQALLASGLLVEKLGGPSVRPYQPAGLAKELTGTEDYVQDHGPDLYRRSLYTFWKRTIAPPTLMNFDAANRETCVVRESRTNTPLQALNLLNEVTFVEAARVLAERVLKEPERADNARLTRAFRLVLTRSPRPAELAILRQALSEHRSHYRRHPAAALKLVSTGEAPRGRELDVAEHAAYTAVCNLLFNLDEAITKE